MEERAILPKLMQTWWSRFKQSWRQTSNWNKLLVILTLVIAGANSIYTYFSRKQFRVMNDQLTEMRSSGQQTDKLLVLYAKQVEGIKELVDQEKRYAGAAEKTLDATIVSNRPWVGPVTATVDGPITPGVGNAHLIVVNTGRSPARILRFRGAQGNLEKLPSNPPFPNSTRFPENSHPILVPGSVVEVQFPFVLPNPISDEIRQGKRRFYIYGIVDYQAVGDRAKTYSTKICYFWTLTDKNQFAACQEYNDAN